MGGKARHHVGAAYNLGDCFVLKPTLHPTVNKPCASTHAKWSAVHTPRIGKPGAQLRMVRHHKTNKMRKPMLGIPMLWCVPVPCRSGQQDSC